MQTPPAEAMSRPDRRIMRTRQMFTPSHIHIPIHYSRQMTLFIKAEVETRGQGGQGKAGGPGGDTFPGWKAAEHLGRACTSRVKTC